MKKRRKLDEEYLRSITFLSRIYRYLFGTRYYIRHSYYDVAVPVFEEYLHDPSHPRRPSRVIIKTPRVTFPKTTVFVVVMGMVGNLVSAFWHPMLFTLVIPLLMLCIFVFMWASTHKTRIDKVIQNE